MKLRNDSKLKKPKNRAEPSSESDSITDGTFTLSSLSSPEYNSKDSNASPNGDPPHAVHCEESPVRNIAFCLFNYKFISVNPELQNATHGGEIEQLLRE